MNKLALAAALCVVPVLASAKPYLVINEIKTPKGLTVWAVQDKTVPIMALKFSLKGGSQFDPVGKEGVGNLLTTLFDEGAGKRDAEAFQDALDNYGIRMGFTIGRDGFYGSLKTTMRYHDLAVELFDDAVNRPHIDDDATERMRQAILSSQRFKQMEPGWVAQKTLYETLYPNHPYARLVDGSPKTVGKLTVQDVKQQRETLFCRDNLKISVTGDIDAKKIAVMTDRIFGNWPACKTKRAVQDAVLKNAGKTITIEWKGAQSIMLMAQSGLKREDKDWWAARLLDFVLGGGEFSSRLMEEVRVKRGLTYGISSTIAPYDLGPLWLVQAGVDPSRIDDAVKITKQVWADVARDGVKQDELDEAKSYLIGSLPLALTSTDMIASILIQLQEDNLPKDMLDRRAAEIDAVTMDDIKRVAKERLHADALTTVIVGPKKEQKHEQANPVPAVVEPSAPHDELR